MTSRKRDHDSFAQQSEGKPKAKSAKLGQSKSKAKQPANAASSHDEGDLDFSKAEKFLSLAKTKSAAKSEEVIADLKNLTSQQQKQIMSGLDDKAQLIVAKDRQMHGNLLTIFSRLKSTTPETAANKSDFCPSSLAKSDIAHQSAAGLMEASKALLTEYGEVSRLVTVDVGGTRLDSSFDRDCETLRNLLLRRSRRVEEEISCILKGKDRDTPPPPEAETNLWTRFTTGQAEQKSEKKNADVAEAWLEAVTKAQKAVCYISKYLGEEGTD